MVHDAALASVLYARKLVETHGPSSESWPDLLTAMEHAGKSHRNPLLVLHGGTTEGRGLALTGIYHQLLPTYISQYGHMLLSSKYSIGIPTLL